MIIRNSSKVTQMNFNYFLKINSPIAETETETENYESELQKQLTSTVDMTC